LLVDAVDTDAKFAAVSCSDGLHSDYDTFPIIAGGELPPNPAVNFAQKAVGQIALGLLADLCELLFVVDCHYQQQGFLGSFPCIDTPIERSLA
jgi:hypothetical protein